MYGVWYIYLHLGMIFYGFHAGNHARQPWILSGPFSAAVRFHEVPCDVCRHVHGPPPTKSTNKSTNSCRSRRGSSWDNSVPSHFARLMNCEGHDPERLLNGSDHGYSYTLICLDYVSNGHLLHFLTCLMKTCLLWGLSLVAPF